MKCKSILLISSMACMVACSMSAATAWAQDEETLDWANLKSETVLRAIKEFEAEPEGENSEITMAVIMGFTEASPKVLVGIDISLLPWIKEDAEELKNGERLLVAYVAGNIRTQLQKGINKDQPVDGVIFMCRIYKTLRKAKSIAKVPELEEWSKLDKTGVQSLVTDLQPSEDTEDKTTKPYKDKQTGIVFPRFMGLFELEGAHEYDEKELGVSVRYWTMGPSKVDVYVYNHDYTNLTNGAKYETVQKELAKAEDDILEMGKRGYYKDAKKTATGSGTLKGKTGELDYISATFQYAHEERGQTRETGPLRSHIVLTTYNGYFLKIRFTRAIDSKDDDAEQIADFLKQMGALLEIEPPK